MNEKNNELAQEDFFRREPKAPSEGDRRVMAIMAIGDRDDVADFEAMKSAIITDPDKEVRFAGLKRIHNFKDSPGFESFVDELETRDDLKPYEPYRSMALLRLERINEQKSPL